MPCVVIWATEVNWAGRFPGARAAFGGQIVKVKDTSAKVVFQGLEHGLEHAVLHSVTCVASIC